MSDRRPPCSGGEGLLESLGVGGELAFCIRAETRGTTWYESVCKRYISLV